MLSGAEEHWDLCICYHHLHLWKTKTKCTRLVHTGRFKDYKNNNNLLFKSYRSISICKITEKQMIVHNESSVCNESSVLIISHLHMITWLSQAFGHSIQAQ